MTKETLSGHRRKLALFVYGIGFIFGLMIVIGATWPDMEASLFDTSLNIEGQVPLSCPIFLTPADGVGEVRATIVNPSDERAARVPVRTRISAGYLTLMHEIDSAVQLDPGGKQVLTYDISSSDAAYGRLIFVRVTAFRVSPYPGGQASCGVWWLNIPLFTGGQLLAILLIISIACLGYGNYIWQRQKSESPRSMEFGYFLLIMTVLLLLAMVAGLMGWWGMSLMLLIFIILILAMFGMIIEYFGRSSRNVP